MLKSNLLRLAAAAVVATPVAAFAAGSHDGGHGAAPTGTPGKASAASRTIEVTLHDNYYEPETIEVKAGETVRFRISNAGEFVHEFNIGTAEMHASHQHAVLHHHHHLVDMAAAKAMQASMGHGMHDDPNSVLLEPGKSGEIVWTFPKDADVAIEFACNVPGHYQSGMVGSVAIDH